MKLIHMRNSNNDINRSIKACHRLNMWWIHTHPKNVFTSYFYNHDWMQSADLYINNENYSYIINDKSPLFKKKQLRYFSQFDFVCVKILINSHYNCILINNKKQIFEFFDSSGYSHINKQLLNLYKSIFSYYPFVIVQFENLQKHIYDCYCQTWIYAWFYFKLIIGHTNAQFKRLTQCQTDEDKLEFIISFHKNIIK